MREHIPNIPLKRSDVEQLCPDYALLGDVVNATKHKVLTSQTPHGQPLVNEAKNLEEQILVIEDEDSLGTYRYIHKSVVIKLTDGTTEILLNVLTNVINFWEKYLHSIGILSTARVFINDSFIHERSSTNEAAELNFQLMKEIGLNQTLWYLRHNRKTGKLEPLDLTGYKARLQLYKPVELELQLTHNESRKVFTSSITLSAEENAKLCSLTNDEERQSYISGLLKTQVAMNKLALEAKLDISANRLE